MVTGEPLSWRFGRSQACLGAPPNLKTVQPHPSKPRAWRLHTIGGFIEVEGSKRSIAFLVGNVNAVSVAEHAFFLMLTVARSAVRLDAPVRTGDFAARSRIPCIKLCGRMGQEVAARARPFGLNVIVFLPVREARKFPQCHRPNAPWSEHERGDFWRRLPD